MRTLNKPQASGNVTEARPQPEDIAARIEEVLQQFNVLSSKADRHLVRYAYLYLLVAALLFTVPYIVAGALMSSKVAGGLNSSFIPSAIGELQTIIGTCLIIWAFNIWRGQVPHILREVFEKKRIQASAGDTAREYLGFLEHYRDLLRSPKRYLLIGSLEIIAVMLYLVIYLETIARLAEGHANIANIVDIVIVILFLLVPIVTALGLMYYLGVLLWALVISGWHIRDLSRRFAFSIEPVHPDHCGGLRVLGNFCFGAVAPLFTVATFFVGYFGYLVVLNPPLTEGPRGTIPLILLVYVFPAAVLGFFLPLWNIHTNMLRERETAEENYVAQIAALREQIRVLLADNRLEEAKAVKEKKELLAAEYLPYPTWPFYGGAKLFSTVLGMSGSLVLGVLTALLSQILLRVVLR